MAKGLGVMIDSSLSYMYNEHVTKSVSNCLHRLTRINRIKHPLDRKTLLLLTDAFVFSKLFCCSTDWSNTSKTNVKRLQLAQNFAGRIVLGLRKYDHISEGLKSLKWLSVSDKLFLYDSIMVHKCMNGRAPGYLLNKFTRRLEFHDENMRYNKDLNLLRCKLKTDPLPIEGLPAGIDYPKTLKK